MSDLREALERIVAQRGSSHVVGVINMSELRELLAAHPPEPSPEVVVDHRPGVTCPVAAEVDPETGFARPLLDREEVRSAIAYEFGPHAERQVVWDAAEAVLKLARPMPTQEQIEQAVRAAGIGSYSTIVAAAVLALLKGTN